MQEFKSLRTDVGHLYMKKECVKDPAITDFISVKRPAIESILPFQQPIFALTLSLKNKRCTFFGLPLKIGTPK